jgi:hypothetical protein
MAANSTPVETRAQDAALVAQCSLSGLQDCLPLIWRVPPDTLPSPKKAYRSHYVYQGWADILAPPTWEHLSDFDLVLRLVDLEPLRPGLEAFRSRLHIPAHRVADHSRLESGRDPAQPPQTAQCRLRPPLRV